MLNNTVHDLSVVVAQLVEAACCARDGDPEEAKIHIGNAVARLNARLTAPVAISLKKERRHGQVHRGGLAFWQARRVAAQVDANLAEKVSIPQLAQSVRLSASHFSRAFKCTFGMPPHAWVMRRRMEVAQGLLLTTSATLSEIAFTCGMADQAHFTRCFRRVFGDTPYVWRRARRATLEGSAEEIALCTSKDELGTGRFEDFLYRVRSPDMPQGATLQDEPTAVPDADRGATYEPHEKISAMQGA